MMGIPEVNFKAKAIQSDKTEGLMELFWDTLQM